ncbi:MAG TPA: TonB-dependent receptor [Gemmatimonadales bacterium]|nr:TonB-dependent receptor [Gemmatimonadales bacterium]
MLSFAIAALLLVPPTGTSSHDSLSGTLNLTGTITDSATTHPLSGADLSLLQGERIVARTTTDAFGRYTLHDLEPGDYQFAVRLVGYHPVTRPVTLSRSTAVTRLDVTLVSAPIELSALEVVGALPVAVDTRTGDQIYRQDAYHGSPTTTTSQIIQQSIAGAARAPTGEVHIRGQHAEYTYYVDGVPVPSGISGSLNELFDPSIINNINFVTGAWDAEYGNKNSAVVNVSTRIPPGPFHFSASAYGGSFNSNGQTLSLSTNAGKWGFFASGTRQETDMRREPVVYDTTDNKGAVNFSNHGLDWFAFGKVRYTPDGNDILDLNGNWSQTKFQVPYDSTGGVFLDDNQKDVNSFVNLGWRHLFAARADESVRDEFFAGAFYRHGSLDYVPGENDTPSFIFFPDTLTPYNLSEARNFNTLGAKVDYTLHVRHGLEFKAGILASSTTGHEDFATVDSAGNPGPASNSDLKGWDAGVYAQTAWSPVEWFEVRAGLRWDNHNAPFAGTQSQVSPRLRLNFFPDPANTIYLYYGRQFLPTNVEDLRAITSTAQGGVATVPTLPQRDHVYEAGYIHRFPYGVVAKLAGYHKDSKPGIDDNTVPGSAIVTSVNLAEVHITGIEAVIEVRPKGPVTGFVNLALNHAYGAGPVTGGFFPTDNPPGFFDLDHDQRLSGTVGINYEAHRLFVSLTGIYGSGLTNGEDPDASYGTGLFDFNKSIKVDPSFITNGAIGYTITAGTVIIEPQIYVDNMFDHKYILKGQFFSGPSVGRPRSVQFRVNVAH